MNLCLSPPDAYWQEANHIQWYIKANKNISKILLFYVIVSDNLVGSVQFLEIK